MTSRGSALTKSVTWPHPQKNKLLKVHVPLHGWNKNLFLFRGKLFFPSREQNKLLLKKLTLKKNKKSYFSFIWENLQILLEIEKKFLCNNNCCWKSNKKKKQAKEISTGWTVKTPAAKQIKLYFSFGHLFPANNKWQKKTSYTRQDIILVVTKLCVIWSYIQGWAWNSRNKQDHFLRSCVENFFNSLPVLEGMINETKHKNKKKS